jgi:hypothetical protein
MNCYFRGVDCTVNFEGFAHTNPSTGYLYYKAFKFASLKPAAGAATVEHPDQIQAGRIEVKCEEVIVLPGKREDRCLDPKWGTDAANKKLPEGELQGWLAYTACSSGRTHMSVKHRMVHHMSASMHLPAVMFHSGCSSSSHNLGRAHGLQLVCGWPAALLPPLRMHSSLDAV